MLCLMILTLKQKIMKNALTIIALSIFFIGCNVNLSKEARIQKLEAEIQQSIEKIDQLEKRIGSLEEANTALLSKIEEMGNH